MKNILVLILLTCSLGLQAQSFGSTIAVTNEGRFVIDADYQTVLDRGTALAYTLPTPAYQLKASKLCTCIKSADIWTLIDAMWFLASGSTSSSFATLNIKAPSSYQATLSGSPTYNIATGFQGNGSSSYVDFNFNTSTNGVNYTQNSAGRIMYIHTAPTTTTSTTALDGVAGSGANTMRYSNTAIQRVNQGTTNLNAAADPTGTGYKAIDRSTSSDVAVYSGTTKIDRTQTSSAMVNDTQTLHRSGANYGDGKIAFYAITGHLTQTQHSDLRSCLIIYITSL